MDMLESGNYEQAAHANGKESNMTSLEYAPLPTARGDLWHVPPPISLLLVTRGRYHTEMSMWAISASPLVVTTPSAHDGASNPHSLA